MKSEPELLNCMALLQRDHKANSLKLYCQKHGTTIYSGPFGQTLSMGDLRSLLLPLWRNRECKDLP